MMRYPYDYYKPAGNIFVSFGIITLIIGVIVSIIGGLNYFINFISFTNFTELIICFVSFGIITLTIGIFLLYVVPRSRYIIKK